MEKSTILSFIISMPLSPLVIMITEAINAITQYAFNVLKVKRLAITCDVDNERSKRVPERLGYNLEATMKAIESNLLVREVTDTFSIC